MSIIGFGAQYKVINTHGGRVRKLLQSRSDSQAIVKSWYEPGQTPSKMLAIDYQKRAVQTSKKIQRLLGIYPELDHSFGNPAFEHSGTYTQNKVQTLGEALRESSYSHAKRLIDAYVNLILHHMRYGLFEQVSNCTINNGVDHLGRVILIDFGEVTFNKANVRVSIVQHRWLGSFSYGSDIPKPLRDYYKHQLDTKLTLKALQVSWKISSKNSSLSS